MPKPVKSQWDFGELFPVEQPRKVFSVTELTWQIKRLLEKEVGQIWVAGEVSNLSSAGSGHIYFTIKDGGGQLSCVLFRGETQVDRSALQTGRKVILQGEITVYETRGIYQLRVTKVELEGIGALQAAFEKLKQKLQAEGLFATNRKRLLPRYAQRIGLVTSPTGAAIRDVLHVVARRHPGLQIVLAACRVQGQGAAREIADAIGLLNEFHARARASLDLILVTRGGGSLEDLWAFNEEALARAIFESALPVVSAVGHEIDFTISDFVADVRAATPSAAAEVITEGMFSSGQFVAGAALHLRQLAGQQFEDKRLGLLQLSQRLGRVHPHRRLNDWLQRLDDARSGLLRCAQQGARERRVVWQNLGERLSRVRPALVLRQRREVLNLAAERLREQCQHRVREWKSRLDTLTARLRLLGPEQVLARGYSITMIAATGKVLRSAAHVTAGQTLKTRLKAGEVLSEVVERSKRTEPPHAPERA